MVGRAWPNSWQWECVTAVPYIMADQVANCTGQNQVGDIIFNGPPLLTSLPQPQSLKDSKAFKIASQTGNQSLRIRAYKGHSDSSHNTSFPNLLQHWVVLVTRCTNWKFPLKVSSKSWKGCFLCSTDWKVEPLTAWFLLITEIQTSWAGSAPTLNTYLSLPFLHIYWTSWWQIPLYA